MIEELNASVLRWQMKHGLGDDEVAEVLTKLSLAFEAEAAKWAGIDWEALTDEEYDALLDGRGTE